MLWTVDISNSMNSVRSTKLEISKVYSIRVSESEGKDIEVKEFKGIEFLPQIKIF